MQKTLYLAYEFTRLRVVLVLHFVLVLLLVKT